MAFLLRAATWKDGWIVFLSFAVLMACLTAVVVCTGIIEPRLRHWRKRQISHWPASVRMAFEPWREDWLTVGGMAIVLLGGAWLFFDILEDLMTEPALAQADGRIYSLVQTLRRPWLDEAVIVVTEVGDGVVVMSVAIAAAVWFACRRAWRTLIYWITGVAGAALITSAIKLALKRPRPVDLAYGGADMFSFPSGHSTTNMALYGLVLILLFRHLNRTARIGLIVCVMALVGGIGFSRIYLGAHWASDVVGGWAFAAAWISVLGISYYRHSREEIGHKQMLIVVVASLLTMGTIEVCRHHASDMQFYERRNEIVVSFTRRLKESRACHGATAGPDILVSSG